MRLLVFNQKDPFPKKTVMQSLDRLAISTSRIITSPMLTRDTQTKVRNRLPSATRRSPSLQMSVVRSLARPLPTAIQIGQHKTKLEVLRKNFESSLMAKHRNETAIRPVSDRHPRRRSASRTLISTLSSQCSSQRSLAKRAASPHPNNRLQSRR